MVRYGLTTRDPSPEHREPAACPDCDKVCPWNSMFDIYYCSDCPQIFNPEEAVVLRPEDVRWVGKVPYRRRIT